MRALLLTIDFPPLGGGISRYYEDLARFWPAEELTVLAPDFPGSREVDSRLPCHVLRRSYFLSVPTGRVIREMPSTLVHARQAVKDLRPHLVLCGQPLTMGTVGLTVASGRPVVVFAHGEELRRPWSSPWRRKLLGWVLGRARRVVVVSEYGRREVRRYGVPPENILRVTGVDAARFAREKEPEEGAELRSLLGGRPVVLTVGRLERRKGHDVVVASLPHLAEKVPGVTVVVVGEGEEGDSLRAQARSLGVAEQVCFLERVEEPLLDWLYRKADVFCLASRAGEAEQVEGLGLVFLEAAASGTPSVGTRVGGIPDAVVDGETGILVSPEVPGELARALTRILTDRELGQRMGECARKRVLELYDWRRNAPALRHELARLLGPGGS